MHRICEVEVAVFQAIVSKGGAVVSRHVDDVGDVELP